MIKRIYIHNFRCFENFEFNITGQQSSLLIGKNGSGKSTLREVFKIFQSIGRGVTRVGQLVKQNDFCRGQTEIPMRFEMEILLNSMFFSYMLVFELPERFQELRIKEERLSVDGEILFSREQALVTLRRNAVQGNESQFNIDWHMVAMPVIQGPSASSSLGLFRDWLASMVLLAPIPKLMQGDAEYGTKEPEEDASNWAHWLSGLLERYPAAYSTINQHLSQLMPDFESFRFERTVKEAKTLMVRFRNDHGEFESSSESLSDGEKCFFLCSVVLAANKYDGPLFTFWDEPESHLSLNEISHFVLALRKGFQQKGQLVMTSHNPEAIRRFSDDSTWVMGRHSHLEPTIIRQLQEVAPSSDLIQKLIDGDIEPWA